MKWLKSKTTINKKFVDFVDKLPLAIIAGLTGFSLVAIVLLLLNQFQTQIIWTLGLVFAAIGAWIVFKFGGVERPGTSKTRFIFDVFAIVGVLVWGFYNIQLTSQHVLTNRDPALYANAASWLAERTDLKIGAPDTFKNTTGVSNSSQGFEVDRDTGNVIYAQGEHILPALLGSIGKFIGPKHILHFNILFGMTALLAIFCFARLFMKPYWAIIGATVISLSLPMLYFSRDTYTEPLAATFTFGGLALIWIAQKNKSLLLWALAGLTVGAGVLTRVDGYLSLIGVVTFLAMYTIIVEKKDLKLRLLQTVVFLMPALFMCLLAWLDLVLLSKTYLTDLIPLISKEIFLLLGVILFGSILAVIIRRYPNILKWVNVRTIRWRAIAGAMVVLAIGLILVSRPIWMEGITAQQSPYVAGLQQFERSPVEPRSYSEITTNWVSWYIGPVLSCLGLAGLAYATYKSLHSKDMLLLCGLLVVMGTSLVYFIEPSIFPDQIWASRRMLPVIMPGIAIFGVYAASAIAERIKLSSTALKNSLIAFAAVGLIIAPLITSNPFIGSRDTAEYAFVSGLCANLPTNAVVIWLGVGGLRAVQPTRTYCHVESYSYKLDNIDKPTTKKLAEIATVARSHDKTPIIAMYSSQMSTLVGIKDQNKVTRISEVVYSEIIPTLTTPPTHIRNINIGASLAIINNDGSLKLISKKVDLIR